MPLLRSYPTYLMHWVGLTETWKLIHCRSTWRSGVFVSGIGRFMDTFLDQIATERGRGGRMSKDLRAL